MVQHKARYREIINLLAGLHDIYTGHCGDVSQPLPGRTGGGWFVYPQNPPLPVPIIEVNSKFLTFHKTLI